MGRKVRIARWVDEPDRDRLTGDIETIFFAASGVQTFADVADRAAFRQRWLGLYLEAWPDLVWLARDDEAAGRVAGYLVGCLVDPARDDRFGEIGYFQAFAAKCAVFPAHLHINLAPLYRARGIGGRLIAAFAEQATQAGAPGLHIVTTKDARNVGFYRRQGFIVVAEAPSKGVTVVAMGRNLDGA